MRVIRNLTGTLLIAGMASMAYAWSPHPINSGVTASAAQQEQETPPKQDESKPKDAKPAKPAKAGQQPANAKQPGEDRGTSSRLQNSNPPRPRRVRRPAPTAGSRTPITRPISDGPTRLQSTR